MVWGGLSVAGFAPLVKVPSTLNTDGYIHLLQHHVLPLRLPENGITFIQDNAPVHKSRRSMNWFNHNNISLMDWPPQSPDLNIIENAWSYLKTLVERHEIHTLQDVWEAAEHEWMNIPNEYFQKLIESMPRRVEEVIRRKGGQTRY